MASDQNPINESVSIDLGKQFAEMMGRLLSTEADTATTFKYQAKILSELESRDEEEILDEMNEERDKIHKSMAGDFYRSLGFSEEFISEVTGRGEND